MEALGTSNKFSSNIDDERFSENSVFIKQEYCNPPLNRSFVEFEDDGDWVENFIQVVQSKPAIYDTDLPEHSDRHLISRLWNEVCEAIVPSWQEMTLNEKSTKVKDLQNRWKNLKTCFRRELKKQKQCKSGRSTKRRKYLYFDQLLFLLPTIKDRPTVTECTPDNSESEIEESNICNITHPVRTVAQQPIYTSYKKANKTKKISSYEDSLLTILKEKKEEEMIDEDKSFLLSLVPTFKKLNDVQKIDAKMEFLSVLKRLTQPIQTSYKRYGNTNYALHGDAENCSQSNSLNYYNYSVDCPSGSSTPNPVPSEVSQPSRSSSSDSSTPRQNKPD